VSLQTSPFYGFFRLYHLKELTLDEATLLLTNIAKFESDHELASFIRTPLGRARLRAVHHLAGGNHRVYVIFSQFLTRELLDELVEPFMHTLDDLTPYYQARMTWLSPQQRKIVEFLCDRRHAVTVKEIAQRCFMTHQTASSQLKLLRETGYADSIPSGRQSYYELREPLMRLCIEVKKHRGEPIRLLVDFLRLWYSPAELQQRLALLQSDTALERQYLLHALHAFEEEAEDPRVEACLADHDTYMEEGDFVNALKAAEDLVAIRGQPGDWAEQGHCLCHLGRFDEALAALDKSIELGSTDIWVWHNRVEVLYHLKRYEDALTTFDRAVELGSTNVWAWYWRGQALSHLERYEDALVSFDKAIALDPDEAAVWHGRGWVLHSLGRHEEALAALDRVIKLNPQHTPAWSNRGRTLLTLGRHEDALASFNKVVELDPHDVQAWLFRGRALGTLGHDEDALASFDKAIQLDEQFACPFFDRISFLLALERWDDGKVALDDALHHFAKENKEDIAAHTSQIVNTLFTSTRAMTTWQTRIKTLLKLYDTHQVLSALGQGLVQSIPIIGSQMVSTARARKWRDIWRKLTSDHTELQLPLRLLDVAVRYSETHDPHILLELPVEERSLLEPILKIGEEQNNEL